MIIIHCAAFLLLVIVCCENSASDHACVFFLLVPGSRSQKDSEVQPVKGGTMMDLDEDQEEKVHALT